MAFNYQNVIDELIKIESEELSDNDYLLSAYLPAQHLNTEDVRKRLKSLFESEIINKDNADREFDLKSQVITNVNNKIDGMKNYKEGLAIFAVIAVDSQVSKIKVDLNEDKLWIIPLPVLPDRFVFLGKVFNLDQILWIKHSIIRALVVEMNQDEACLYKLNDSDWQLYKSIENPYVEERGKGKNQSGGGTMTYNPQKIKIEKDKIEKARGLMNTVCDEIKNEEQQLDELKHVVIVYTSYFTDIIRNLKSDLSEMFSNSKEIILINKNFENEKELRNEVAKQVRQQIQRNKRNTLKTAKSLFDNYVEGWEKVSEAANLFKIKTLFIKAASEAEGYILENLIYTKPIRGAMTVKNIGPWLVKNVMQSDGQIIVFKNRLGSRVPEIAAQLRY